MKKTYYLATLGCPKNDVDSEGLGADLISAGMSSVDDPEQADLLLVNSCAFIEDAKIETLDTVFGLHKIRKKGSTLVLCGCLPARYNLDSELKEVDLFLSSKEHSELIERLNRLGWKLENHKAKPPRLAPILPFSYLKISEGCDNRCSYCAIPDIKGPFTSRPKSEILNEAEFLNSKNVKELTLIGQDTTLYGKDFNDGYSLSHLLKDLTQFDSIRWIRLIYAHPAHLDNETIAVISQSERIVKYIDLPLQHVNDRILRLMNRRTDKNSIESLIRKLRAKMPEIVLRSTFIVGFPGETEKEFGELLDFIEEFELDNVGVFKYSPEEGTPAFRLSDRIDSSVIDERYLTLLDLQNNISAAKLAGRVGRTETVLLHEIDSEGTGIARGWFQAPEVDGNVFVENCTEEPGNFIDVEIKKADAYDLYAVQVRSKDNN